MINSNLNAMPYGCRDCDLIDECIVFNRNTLHDYRYPKPHCIKDVEQKWKVKNERRNKS